MQHRIRQILVFLVLFSGSSFGQIGELRMSRFSQEDGLSNNYVSDFLQDKNGFIWIATHNGLCRFDGKNFEVFKRDYSNSNSLLNNIVTRIAVDSRNRIWIGYGTHGISCYDQVTRLFAHYKTDSGKSVISQEGITDALYIDNKDVVWIGTEHKGLSYYDPVTDTLTYCGALPHIDSRRTPAARKHFNRISAFHMDGKGLLWMATADGLYSYSRTDKDFKVYRQGPEIIGDWKKESFSNMFADHDSVIWLGGWGVGLNRISLKNNEWKNFLPAPSYSQIGTKNILTSIISKSDSELWVSTYDTSLCLFNTREEKFYYLSAEQKIAHKFPDNFVNILFKDRDQNLWVGHTEGFHVIDQSVKEFRFIPHKVTHSDNSEYYGIHRIYEDTLSDRMFLSTNLADGLNVVEPNGTVSNHTIKVHPGEEQFQNISQVYADRRGTIWVLTRDYLYHYNRKLGRLEPAQQPVPDTSLKRTPAYCKVVEDKAGNLWFATYRHGVYVFDPRKGTFENHHHQTGNSRGLRSNLLSDIISDPSGNIWIGYKNDGISRYEADGKFIHYSGTENDPATLIDNRILALASDALGRIWIGTYTGLSMIDPANSGNEVFNFLKHQELLGIIIFEIICDDRNNVWFSNTHGLSVFNYSTRKLRTYTAVNGLPVNYGSLSFSPASNGDIFIGTFGGYYRFDPSIAWKEVKPSAIKITSFRAAEQEVLIHHHLETNGRVYLRPGDNYFTVGFISINYNDPAGVKYFYRLKGLEEGWKTTGERGYATYTNIPGGDYVFEVKGMNAAGYWSDTTEVPVHIATLFYKTSWFKVLIALLFSLAIFLLYRFRVRDIERTEALKTKFVRKLAETEMRALRAQMNPHFIFNCLNSINRYIIKNDHKTASLYLTKFAKLIRLILDNSENHEVVLSQELDALKLYIEIESLRFDHKFMYEIDVDDNISPDSISIPAMIVQPYVENAIWHGLLHKDSPGKLSVKFRLENDLLICIVEDDGVGREVAMEMKSKSAVTRKSRGLKITSDRLEILNQQSDSKGGITFEDLKNGSEKSAGTRVTIKIPVEAG